MPPDGIALFGIENHGDDYCSDLVEPCQRAPHLGVKVAAVQPRSSGPARQWEEVLRDCVATLREQVDAMQVPFGVRQVDFDWLLGSLQDCGYQGHLAIEYLESDEFDALDSALRLRDTATQRFS